MTEYQDYLSRLHHQNETPIEVISDIIKEGISQDLQDVSRIVSGEVNEVYEVKLADATSVILRISRKEQSEFEKEKWAIERCLERGVPAPRVLFTESIEHDVPLHVCIQEKLDGEPLERGSIHFWDFPEEKRRAIVFQAGEIFSKIHSVETNGFGELDAAGNGTFETFEQLLGDRVKDEEGLHSLAREVGFDEKSMDAVIEIIRKGSPYPPGKASLSHNDYGLKHLFYQDERISGVIDFGEACGHSAVSDFAIWDYWFGDEVPIDWLKEGYENRALFSQDFDQNLRLIRLYHGLGVMYWYSTQHYAQGVDDAKRKLQRDLELYREYL